MKILTFYLYSDLYYYHYANPYQYLAIIAKSIGIKEENEFNLIEQSLQTINLGGPLFIAEALPIKFGSNKRCCTLLRMLICRASNASQKPPFFENLEINRKQPDCKPESIDLLKGASNGNN